MKRKQFLVIGAGRFGSALATTLFDNGHEVVVVDEREEAIENIMDHATHTVIADAADENVLKKLGCNNFDVIVVAIGSNLEANILATVAAKSCGATRVISKAVSEAAARALTKVGADEVIRPEHDMGVQLAQRLMTPNIVDAFELGTEHSVVEVETHDKLEGRLAKLRLPNRFGVQVIAVHRRGELVVSPGADFELQYGDRVVIIGSNEALGRFKDFISD